MIATVPAFAAAWTAHSRAALGASPGHQLSPSGLGCGATFSSSRAYSGACAFRCSSAGPACAHLASTPTQSVTRSARPASDRRRCSAGCPRSRGIDRSHDGILSLTVRCSWGAAAAQAAVPEAAVRVKSAAVPVAPAVWGASVAGPAASGVPAAAVPAAAAAGAAAAAAVAVSSVRVPSFVRARRRPTACWRDRWSRPTCCTPCSRSRRSPRTLRTLRTMGLEPWITSQTHRVDAVSDTGRAGQWACAL
jgi:hypothetical protein